MGETLKANRTRTKLDFGYSIIGDLGATSIGEALKIKQTLTILNLERNKIGGHGEKTLRGTAAAKLKLIS